MEEVNPIIRKDTLLTLNHDGLTSLVENNSPFFWNSLNDQMLRPTDVNYDL